MISIKDVVQLREEYGIDLRVCQTKGGTTIRGTVEQYKEGKRYYKLVSFEGCKTFTDILKRAFL